ncbi:MAG: Zn-dependent exopeptidase M28 [Deltaproteobacteria bacterium]
MKSTHLTKRDLKLKLRLIALPILICLAAVAYWSCSTERPAAGDQKILARVEVKGYLEDLNLPVYADLEDEDGVYYALVIATRAELDRAGAAFRIIDIVAPGTRYIIAWDDEDDAHEKAAGLVNVLYDDGEHLIVRYKRQLTELLPDLGFDIWLMSKVPINVIVPGEVFAPGPYPAIAAIPFVKNPDVDAMIKAVKEEDIKAWTEHLSGEKQVEVNGSLVTLSSRHTYQTGTKIAQATKYVYDQLKEMGLAVSFFEWTSEDEETEDEISSRNVVGEIRGTTNPDEIIILIAHLDTISEDEDGIEPGADDNASGCVGLLAAADIMRFYKFKRTIRFVFTTGEEQGLYGGTAYAEKMEENEENVVAVLNLDMIGYSKKTNPYVKPKQQIKIRHRKNKTGHTRDLPIAQTYVKVVSAYGMDQVFDAVIEDDGEDASDHAPFWDLTATCLRRNPAGACYPAAWAIEYAEEGFINPEMHTGNDRVGILNMPYYTAIVKAALGTAAHLAETTN